MSLDLSVFLVLSFGWILMIFQYVLPLYSRYFLKSTKVDVDLTIKKQVAVLLPCFNEGPLAYNTIKSICQSKYPHELIEIIAVDDHSTDDSWDWIQKAVVEFAPTNVKLTAYRQPHNKGKYEALLRGAHLAKGAELFVCIDSDCTFAPDAIAQLVGTFTTKDIAAVGGHVRVSNVNQNILTQAQTLVYFYAYHVMKMFQNYLRNVTCISGCLFAIKRDAFFNIAPDVANCNFLGAKFSAGEDRYMTHLLMLRGYHTCVNLDANCWTEVPHKYNKFFMQQWRWRRSGIQDYLLTLKTFKQHTMVLNPLSVINLLLPETVNYVLLFTLFYSIVQGKLLQWIVSHQLFSIAVMTPFVLGVMWFMRKVAPEQLPKSSAILLLPLISAWTLTGTMLCALLGLFTMDSSSWGTRVPNKK